MTTGHLPRPILVLGTGTCEDTAIVRDRLRATGTPHEYIDVSVDMTARSRVERLNGGHVVTPTLIVGDEALVVAEPGLEDLPALVARAGLPYAAPAARHLHGTVAARRIPAVTLPTDDGRPVSLGTRRSQRQVALFLGHAAACRVCLGYARQLARRGEEANAADGDVVIVVAGGSEAAASWRPDIGSGPVLLADGDGAWKDAVTREVGAPPDAAALLVLDRYLAPRALASAEDAGGLVDPADVVAWLRFVELDCPECTHEVDWPEV